MLLNTLNRCVKPGIFIVTRCHIGSLSLGKQLMKSATELVKELFLAKADEVEYEKHPYSGIVEALHHLGYTAWDDERRQPAIEALELWVLNMLASAACEALNEINVLGSAAAAAGGAAAAAAEELRTSMGFVELMAKSFVSGIDVRHIAEAMFEHGVQRWGVPAPGAKPTKQIQNWWVPSRMRPSTN